MNVKDLVKRAISTTGYQVVNLRARRDSFQQQAWLLNRQETSPTTILDLGANVGQTNRRYREHFPDAMIHSFEPFPAAFAELSALTSRDPKTKVHQLAASDVRGVRTFYTSVGSQMNSLLKVTPGGETYMGGVAAAVTGSIEVNTTTIDAFCSEYGIEEIDILKMDIQGGELAALRGAARMLQSRAIRLIYTEVLFAEMYQGAAPFDVLWRHLESAGYQLEGLYNLANGSNDMLGYGDAIFLIAR